MATDHSTTPPQSKETSMAIIGSAVIGLVLATAVAGSPLSATQAAYTDYTHTMVAPGGPGPTAPAAPAK